MGKGAPTDNGNMARTEGGGGASSSGSNARGAGRRFFVVENGFHSEIRPETK